MSDAFLFIGIAVLAAVVVLVATLMPARLASRGHRSPHADLDAETEAYLEHPPGGGTGGI